MAIKITHITVGQAGLQAQGSEELQAAIVTLQGAGYRVEDIEDDVSEPWHVATIHYTGGPQVIRTIQQLVGAPGAYRHKA